METLKLMLSQRGIPVTNVETLTVEFPGTVTKIGDVIVFKSTRQRISEKDVLALVGLTQEHGGKTGIIIVPIPPSETILYAVSQQSHILQIFHESQLIDISRHRAVPPHRILTQDEVKAFLAKYNISTDKIVSAMQKDHIQLDAETSVLQQIAMKYKEYFPMPQIWSQDAMARWVGAKPGDIVEILRKSMTAGGTPYYRFCVASV